MAEADEPDSVVRKRGNTRARLIRAARRLFFARPYHAITVDLVAREAGFTRAAFYLHFTGKDDLVAAMMIAESHRTDPLFGWFAGRARTREAIDGFIRAFVAAGQATPGALLFNIAALQSEAARDAFRANRQRLMAVLGADFPAFRPARNGGEAERRRVAEATLAIVALEQLALRELAMADPARAEALIAAVTDQLLALDTRYPTG